MSKKVRQGVSAVRVEGLVHGTQTTKTNRGQTIRAKGLNIHIEDGRLIR